MNIEFTYGNRVLNLPASVLSFLGEATADELRVLLALAEEKTDIETVVRLSGVTRDRALAAVAHWVSLGVAAGDAETPSEVEKPAPRTGRPAYSGEDMERIAESSDMRELVDVCSAILGKTFTAAETESIYYLHDGLRLDFEFVLRLCKHCYDMGKPSLRYIEKVGISLYDEGVTTVGALNAYISREERKNDMEYRIRNLYGIGERALTPKERECVARWTIEWNLPFELIELAYNDMMTHIAAPKFHYENGILKKWVEAGVHTKEEAEAFAASHKKAKKEEKNAEVGFDLDEFFEAAARRGASTESGNRKDGEV